MAGDTAAAAKGKKAASLLPMWLLALWTPLLSLRYVQQATILTWKNLLVSWRNRRATLLRLLAPFVFLLLALVIQLSLDANSKRQERIRETDSPPSIAIAPIPSCHEDLYIASKPCVNFLYSPNTSTLVKDIIDGIRLHNTPPMRSDQVLGFATRVQAEDWMMFNPESTLGAVHFTLNELSSPPGIQYTLQTNTTAKGFRGSNQSPVTFFTMPLVSAVAREIARVQLSQAAAATAAAAGGGAGSAEAAELLAAADGLQWEPRLVVFPHPQLRSIGMVGYVLGPFIFAAVMFSMVIQLGAVVGEKEGGLVTALRLMGLRQSAYWTSWVAADLLLGMATALSIVVWGLILQFRFFLRNDAGLLVLLFWLFSLALSSFSYFLSVFMHRAQTATYTGFAVFLIGWICQTVIVFGLPYDPSNFFAPSGVGRAFFWIFALLPWCPLSKATMDLASATNTDKSPGLRWSQRTSYCQYIPDVTERPPVDPTSFFINYDCIYPLSQIYLTLILQAVGWLLLAVYLDNVLPGPNKRARPPWYFLMPSYWVRGWGGASQHSKGLHTTHGVRSGLSGRQQQQLVAQISAATAAREAAREAAGRGVVGEGSQQRQAADDAVVDMAGSSGSSASRISGVDEGVAAEEAAMQALLLQLLPPSAAGSTAAAAAHVSARATRRTHPSGGGAGVAGASSAMLSSTPSWPQLQSLEVGEQQQPQPEQTASGSGDGSSSATAADANCDIPDASSAANYKSNNNTTSSSSGSGAWNFGGYAVAVFGLSKVFRGSSSAACAAGKCCAGRGSSKGGGGSGDFHALRGLWLGIRPGQVLSLLGPNGAGKSTSINCLTGLLAPSGGDMLVCGESILTEGGLDRATGLIGVCPQFDVLWGELTGREHLLVAGHVKGLPWPQVPGAASDLLSRVQLTGASHVRAAAYSGGMKRRLSVALALVGDPKVLFLDEPTTGMDPISRRAVWDVVNEAKQGRAVVLTTHSMEEADVLGDRIGIMARGKLRALGSSIRLKQKFGTGYQVLISLLDAHTISTKHTSNAATSTNTTSSSTHDQEEQQQAGASAAASASSGAAPQTGPAPTPHQQHPSNNISSSGLGMHIPATIIEDSSSSGSGSGGGVLLAAPGSPREGGRRAAAAAASMAATRTAVRQLFAAHLSGLEPSEENKRSLMYLVPRAQQQQLVGLLQQLETAMAAGGSSGGGSSGGVVIDGLDEEGVVALARGVADVQLSLTSLEEVFLSIAKQAELELSAESGATATITLPDTGQQVKVAVGQDWLQIVETSHASETDSAVDGGGGAQRSGGWRSWLGAGSAGSAGSRAGVHVASGGGGGGVNAIGGGGGVGSRSRAYSIMWVQDENGALAVLEVVPVAAVAGTTRQQAMAPVAS